MRLVRLIYASRLKKNVNPAELAKISKGAKKKNAELDITGILVFGNDYFLQALEGGRQAVNLLYANIAVDPRHEHCILLEYTEISERDFEDWSMKLVLLTSQNTKSLRRFSTTADFNPFILSGANAHKLLLSLRKTD